MERVAETTDQIRANETNRDRTEWSGMVKAVEEMRQNGMRCVTSVAASRIEEVQPNRGRSSSVEWLDKKLTLVVICVWSKFPSLAGIEPTNCSEG